MSAFIPSIVLDRLEERIRGPERRTPAIQSLASTHLQLFGFLGELGGEKPLNFRDLGIATTVLATVTSTNPTTSSPRSCSRAACLRCRSQR